MATHPAIDKWGQKKYGKDYNLPEGCTFRIEQETRSGGYCDTCWYEDEVTAIYVTEPGQEERKLVDEYEDLAYYMREILDATS